MYQDWNIKTPDETPLPFGNGFGGTNLTALGTSQLFAQANRKAPSLYKMFHPGAGISPSAAQAARVGGAMMDLRGNARAGAAQLQSADAFANAGQALAGRKASEDNALASANLASQQYNSYFNNWYNNMNTQNQLLSALQGGGGLFS